MKRMNAQTQEGTVGKSEDSGGQWSRSKLQLVQLPFTGCVIVGKLLNLSELQFLQLSNGDDGDNRTYLTEL